MNKIMLVTLSFILLFSACAPAPTTTPAPLGSTSAFVETVDAFYRKINEAQTEADLLNAYNLLTTDAMCNARIVPVCDASRFQTKWWKMKVSYKLYDCGDNVVFAEETRYSRSDSSAATPAAPQLLRFDLMQNEEGILINDITRADASGDGCVLVLER